MRKTVVSRVSRKALVSLLLLAAACVVPACGSKHTPSDDLGARLESDTGVTWGVINDPRSQAPRMLTPSSAVRLGSGTPEADARAFFDHYGKQLGTAGHELRVTVNEKEKGGPDAPDGSYVRFDHFVAGTNLRVFDTSSMAHFDATGAAYVVQPGFRAGLDSIPHAAQVTVDAALRAATAKVVADCGLDPATPPASAPELGVAADEDQPLTLAYRIPFSQVTEQCLSPEVDIDATTGAVVRVHAGAAALTDHAFGFNYYQSKGATRDLMEIDVTSHWHPFGRNTYTLETESSSPKVVTQNQTDYNDVTKITTGETYTQDHLGGWDAATPNTYAPGSAVDAHFNVGLALRYFYEVHARKGMDGKNGDVYVIVHDNAENGNNANRSWTTTPWWFFFHTSKDAVTIGDGDLLRPHPSVVIRRNLKPMSVALDAMAHEVAHGVTAYTSHLKYLSESGALNETFSDVMGMSVDQWHSPERHRKGEALHGDRVTPDGSPIRDMNDPTSVASAKQVDHYDHIHRCKNDFDRNPKTGDSCGVHYDSGIGNRAWSLMTLGGTHSGSGIHVSSPIGWEKSRVLWYETFTRLTEQSTIKEAAVAQMQWASAYDKAILNTVGCAWYAVGAFDLDPKLSPLVSTLFCPKDPSAIDAGTNPPPPGQGPASDRCGGRADGWICDRANRGGALACNAAAMPNTVTCGDLAQHCKWLTSTDPTATVDATGALTCE